MDALDLSAAYDSERRSRLRSLGHGRQRSKCCLVGSGRIHRLGYCEEPLACRIAEVAVVYPFLNFPLFDQWKPPQLGGSPRAKDKSPSDRRGRKREMETERALREELAALARRRALLDGAGRRLAAAP